MTSKCSKCERIDWIRSIIYLNPIEVSKSEDKRNIDIGFMNNSSSGTQTLSSKSTLHNEGLNFSEYDRIPQGTILDEIDKLAGPRLI